MMPQEIIVNTVCQQSTVGIADRVALSTSLYVIIFMKMLIQKTVFLSDIRHLAGS
jgi:hypothetical protein